jgi:hypothetical protein
MANVLISDLTASGALAGTEEFEIEVAGSSKSATIVQIQTYVLASYAGASSIVATGTVSTGTWFSRIKKRVSSVASGASITVDSDLYDCVYVNTLATDTTINNPTGTPEDFQELEYRILSDSTPRVLTFQSDFNFSPDLAAPATTSASVTLVLKFSWDRIASKWQCLSILDNL